MTAEEFFKDCIMDVVGIVVSNEKIIYIKRLDGKKAVWVADLEITSKNIKWMWCNWDEIYMPLIDNFKMTENEIAEFIKRQLNVDFVCLMPSVERYCRYNPLRSSADVLIDPNFKFDPTKL